jgi:hypothetical protein
MSCFVSQFTYASRQTSVSGGTLDSDHRSSTYILRFEPELSGYKVADLSPKTDQVFNDDYQ